MMLKYSPTKEQVNIEKYTYEGGDCKVEAYAGTGKSATAEIIADAVGGRVLYLVFGKSNQLEAEERMPSNATCKTGHALAYGPTIRILGRDKLVTKASEMVKALIDHPLTDPLRKQMQDEEGVPSAFATVKTLEKYLQSGAKEVNKDHVSELYRHVLGEEGTGTLIEVTDQVWKASIDSKTDVPFTFDTFLKYYALSEPELGYDTIILDEAQDSNPPLLDIVLPQEAQRIMLGDPNQAIYGWRGAVDAMQVELGETFPLSASFRFGAEIAEQATRVLRLSGQTLPLTGAGKPGTVTEWKSLPPVGTSKATILCRGNFGVIRETVAALDSGYRVHIKGGADAAANLLKAAFDLYTTGETSHPELALFKTWDDLEKFAETDEGRSYRPVVLTVHQYGYGIPNLCRRLKYETEKYAKTAQITVSTCHKAKGLQWKEVHLATDYPDLVSVDDKGRVHFDREEANLLYVGITRAKEVLNIGEYGFKLSEWEYLLSKKAS